MRLSLVLWGLRCLTLRKLKKMQGFHYSTIFRAIYMNFRQDYRLLCPSLPTLAAQKEALPKRAATSRRQRNMGLCRLPGYFALSCSVLASSFRACHQAQQDAA
jgi:hypothetical protein